MLMTVVMVDAAAKLPNEDQAALAQGSLAELLYADDTLLLSVSTSTLERFLAAVSKAGATYGLELHWGKLQLLRIRSESPVRRPDGSCIDSKEDISYLGTSLHGDGRVERELARRLGVAHADFRSLMRLWGHTSVSRSRKLQVFRAVISSRLLYGLSSATLNAAERRRLDGFQNRCLRALWGIKPAYISRTSNAEVLHQTGQRPLSESLLKQQLLLLGRVARAQHGD